MISDMHKLTLWTKDSIDPDIPKQLLLQDYETLLKKFLQSDKVDRALITSTVKTEGEMFSLL